MTATLLTTTYYLLYHRADYNDGEDFHTNVIHHRFDTHVVTLTGSIYLLGRRDC